MILDDAIKPIWQFYFDNFNGDMDASLEGIAHDELEQHIRATWDAALSCFMAFGSGYDTKENGVLAKTLIQGEIFCNFHYRPIETR